MDKIRAKPRKQPCLADQSACDETCRTLTTAANVTRVAAERQRTCLWVRSLADPCTACAAWVRRLALGLRAVLSVTKSDTLTDRTSPEFHRPFFRQGLVTDPVGCQITCVGFPDRW